MSHSIQQQAVRLMNNHRLKSHLLLDSKAALESFLGHLYSNSQTDARSYLARQVEKYVVLRVESRLAQR